jgi:hypothetical protein
MEGTPLAPNTSTKLPRQENSPKKQQRQSQMKILCERCRSTQQNPLRDQALLPKRLTIFKYGSGPMLSVRCATLDAHHRLDTKRVCKGNGKLQLRISTSTNILKHEIVRVPAFRRHLSIQWSATVRVRREAQGLPRRPGRHRRGDGRHTGRHSACGSGRRPCAGRCACVHR